MRKEVIYNLLKQLDEDGSHTVLMELIQWLDADTIELFTDDFCRLHNMLGYEDHELCMDCQETYDMNEEHACDASSRS